jgi:hypothetical protein
MVTWFALVLLAAALVAALMGLTGLVLFIVGLVKKRTGLWVTGLVMGLGVLLLAMAGVAALFFLGVRSTQHTATGVQARAVLAPSPGDEAAARDYYWEATGLELPAEAHCSRFSFAAGGSAGWISMRLDVPPSYGRVLEAEFARVAEIRLEEVLPWGTTEESWPWDVGRAPGMSHFRKTRTDDEGNTHTTTLAFDEATGTLYCAIVIRVPGP